MAIVRSRPGAARPALLWRAMQAPIWPALLTLALYGALVLLLLQGAGGDAGFFVHADERSDGVWYYQMAMAPLGAAREVEPLYYGRILYPLLAWALAVGQAALAPWALLAINVAAVTGCAYLLGALLGQAGRSPWWALLLSGHLGLFVPLLYDLSEPLSLLLGLGGLTLLARGRPGPAWGALLLAALTKETVLVLVAALLAYYLLRRAWRPAAGAAAVIGGGYALWQGAVWLLTGDVGLLSSGLEYSWVPLLHGLRDDLGAGRAVPWPFLIQLGIPAVGLGLLALVSRPGGRWTLAGLVTLAYALFVIYLPWPTTSGFIHYDRTGVGLLLSALLLGCPALEGAALSPTGGLSRRAVQAAFGLVALSTLGGWLLVLVHAQGP
jgi:hypothetical protein